MKGESALNCRLIFHVKMHLKNYRLKILKFSTHSLITELTLCNLEQTNILKRTNKLINK